MYCEKETGVRADEIYKTWTMSQLELRFEKLQKFEAEQVRMNAIAMCHASSAAFNGDSEGHFQDFLDVLSGKKRNVENQLSNFEVEEV